MDDRMPRQALTIQHPSRTADHNIARAACGLTLRKLTGPFPSGLQFHEKRRHRGRKSTSTSTRKCRRRSESTKRLIACTDLDCLAEERRQPVQEAPWLPSVAAEICSIPGSVSVGNPVPVPPTGPRPQFRSPHGPWDGHRAGFRSRAAQEEPPQLNKEETVSIPNKIRKHMKKYCSWTRTLLICWYICTL